MFAFYPFQTGDEIAGIIELWLDASHEPDVALRMFILHPPQLAQGKVLVLFWESGVRHRALVFAGLTLVFLVVATAEPGH